MEERNTDGKGNLHEAPGQIPDRFNHFGTTFESPEADLQLALLQAKIADPRRDPTAVDLVDVLNCELDDIAEQKTYVMQGKDELNAATDQIKRVRKVVLKAASYEFDEITPKEKTLVEKYLDRQIHRWQTRADDPNSTAPLRKEAKENQKIFTNLHENMFTPKHQDQVVSSPQTVVRELEEYANEHFVIGDTTIEKIAPPSLQYEVQPVLANEALRSLGEKEELTEADVQAFYNAVVTDMEEQWNGFDEVHPHMREAVKQALHLQMSRQNEADIDKNRIYVTFMPNDIVHKGFKPPDKRLPIGARQYVFTLSDDLRDPYDLSNNAKYIDDFKAAIKDAQLGQEVITKLFAGDADFIQRLEEDDEAATELLAAVRVIDHMREYLMTHSDRDDYYTESEEKCFRALDKMGAIIMQRSGFNDEDDDAIDPLDGWQTYP